MRGLQCQHSCCPLPCEQTPSLWGGLPAPTLYFHSAERVLSLYRTTTQRGAGFSRRTCADPSIKLRNQARFSRENRSRAARTLASTIAEKPSTEHGFLGKSGADLPGPKHVAQKRSTVLRRPENLLAKFHRARFSLQTRRGPKHFVQEPARSTCSRQNRRGAARTRALAQKPGTDYDFLGKSARTCADLSI